jgi:hypothetical protein
VQRVLAKSHDDMKNIQNIQGMKDVTLHDLHLICMIFMSSWLLAAALRSPPAATPS